MIILTIVIAVFYAIGYAVWMGTSMSSFTKECDQLYDENEQDTACGSVGPSFALFTLVYNICYAPLFACIIIRNFYSSNKDSKNSREENKGVEMRVETSPQSPGQPVHQNQPLLPQPEVGQPGYQIQLYPKTVCNQSVQCEPNIEGDMTD